MSQRGFVVPGREKAKGQVSSVDSNLKLTAAKFSQVRECRCPTPECNLLFFIVRGRVLEILGHDDSLIKIRNPGTIEVRCGRCRKWVTVPMENL